MKITNHIEIDMAQRLPMPPVSAVQNDANTRVIEVTALENGQKWEVPYGVTPAVAFRKPDGRKGLYDELPDGTKAVTFSENVITAVLAPQVLTCSGQVHVAIVLMDANLNRLATFPFIVEAAHDPSCGSGVSNDYYKYSTMEAVSEAVDAALSELETSKQDFLDKAVEALEVVKGAATEDAPAIICEAKGEVITASDASNRTLAGLTVYGKTTQNGTELETAGASGAINITVAGKNILPYPYAFGKRYTENGVTATVSDDGKVTLNGTATADAWVFFNVYSDNHDTGYQFPVGNYWVSGCADYTGVKQFDFVALVYMNGIAQRTAPVRTSDEVALLEIKDKAERVDFRIHVNAGCTMTNAVFSPMIAAVNDGIYEPPKLIQNLTVQTPNGLPGIPVSSGGNYTDESGQKRLCDYKDCANGVTVKRINTKVFNGTEDFDVSNIGTAKAFFGYRLPANVKAHIVGHDCTSMCSHFQKANIATSTTTQGYLVRDMSDSDTTRVLFRPENVASMTEVTFKTWLAEQYAAGTPVTVQYELETPVETPISAEELAQYATLHTNKPNTTVYNDAGAGLKLEYVADTKLYIDQKISAISAAMLNT